MIHQGDKYSYCGVEVLAMEPDLSGDGSWWVRPIAQPWMMDARRAMPEQLTPLPMKYYGGEVPE